MEDGAIVYDVRKHKYDDIISFCAVEYKKIGLDLNLDKVKCTEKGEDIDFMGVVFSHDKSKRIKLSEHLKLKLQDCAEELNELKKHKVPMHMLLLFFEKLVVPKFDYAAFIDEPESKADYELIDAELVYLLCDLLGLDHKQYKEVQEFMLNPREAGGLGAHTPGDNFDRMQ